MKIFCIFQHTRGEEFITILVFQLITSPLSLSRTAMNCIVWAEIGHIHKVSAQNCCDRRYMLLTVRINISYFIPICLSRHLSFFPSEYWPQKTKKSTVRLGIPTPEVTTLSTTKPENTTQQQTTTRTYIAYRNIPTASAASEDCSDLGKSIIAICTLVTILHAQMSYLCIVYYVQILICRSQHLKRICEINKHFWRTTYKREKVFISFSPTIFCKMTYFNVLLHCVPQKLLTLNFLFTHSYFYLKQLICKWL